MPDQSTRKDSMLTRRRVLGLGAGAVGAGLLAACGGTSGPPESGGKKFTGSYDGPKVELQFWNGFTGGDGPFMKKMVADFNGRHDNIKVTMTTAEWQDYYRKVPQAVQAGKGPDVGVAHVDQLATLAARRVISPLDDLAKELGLAEDDFGANIWKAGIYQDKRYGIPLDVHSLAMYTNSTLLTTPPPTDSAGFGQALAALKAKSPTPFWMPSRWPSHLMFFSLLWQNGGKPYAEDGSKAEFASEEGVAALSWQVDQITKGFSPKNVAIDTQYNAFKTGQNAITWDGIWQINDLKATVPNLKWAITPLPTIGQEAAVWANGHNFVLMSQRSDENRQLASKVFINEIGERSKEWAQSGMIPARNSERESAEVQALPQAAIAKNVDQMRFLPPVPGVGDVNTQTLELAVNKAVLGRATPKQALSDAAKTADKLLQENLKKFGG
jgi:multiple sugar transport system substrate-binding protein